MIAPGRAKRPGAGWPRVEQPTEEELASCPFCAGREDRTPPETLAIGRANAAPADSPGWGVRVVPNLYPAFERQEVVVHSPRHVRTFSDLMSEEIELVANAWHVRSEEAWGEGFGYVHALINEGRAAGASLAHSHSQLVWMREPPAGVTSERQDSVETLLQRGELVVGELNDVVGVVHPAGRVPYETVIAPRTSWPQGTDGGDFLVAALVLLADVVRRLRAIEGPVPWNAWLHNGSHWHIELVPRLTVFAGIELGAGIYVNTLAPEDAARALRGASA